MKQHLYQIFLQWAGNKSQGIKNYQAYNPAYEIKVGGKPVILGTSDSAFSSDRSKYNPEELLISSISSCHMLWYLHLCADAGIMVIRYQDHPIGKMSETENGSGRFTEILLLPEIIITAKSSLEQANELHYKALKFCSIANSVNFPVFCQPSICNDMEVVGR